MADKDQIASETETGKRPAPMHGEWETIFQAIGHPAIILAPSHKVLAANNASIKLTGKAAHEMVDRQCYEIFHGMNAAAPPEGCPMEKLLKSGHNETVEMEIEALGGFFLVSCTPIFDEQGKLSKIIHIATDITERKKTETALREAEERYRRLFEDATDAVFIVDEHGNFIDVNKTAYERLGYTKEELMSMDIRKLDSPKFAAIVPERLAQIQKSGVAIFESAHRRKDGTIMPVEVNSRTIDYGGRRVLFSVIRDITERKKAEYLLQESEERYRDLFENAHDMIQSVSLDGKFIFVNRSWLETMGYTQDELKAITLFDVICPDSKAHCMDIFKKLMTGEPAKNIEAIFIAKDGHMVYVEGNVNVRFSDGEIVATHGIFRDITERKQAEEALFFSERKFRHLLETVQLAAVMLDLDGNITFCNDYLLGLTGWGREEVLYKNWFNIFLPEEAKGPAKAVFREIIAKGTTMHSENPVITRNGPIRLIVWDHTVLHDSEEHVTGTASIGIDITDHKKVEEQFRQSQKMEAIGHLAGGVAHDFNNILTAIIGYGNLLKNNITPEDPMHDYVAQILAASEKAAGLTHSLLAFSRKQVIESKPVNINDIVLRMQKILARIIGEDIEVSVKTVPQDLIIKADKGQIEHVLMNLATNARDAMPHGGRLTVTTSEVELDQAFVQAYEYGKAGKYAVISFADTGSGMDKKTKEHIFEPFFTTKEIGKGTGLGLAMVYGTIKQHNGFINLYSEPGEGTIFRIYLPLADSSEQYPEEKTPIVFARGNETILLIEDDTPVRNVTKAMLEHFGHTVIEACDGEKAVELFLKNRDIVQLVVSDIIMPGRNGKDVYNELKRIKPGLKALFISGYTADILAQKDIIDEEVNFISKPLKPDLFSKKIREVLDK
ncbi:MAG: PAS domain S-box protein [Nitrospirae bacterium]|nr:MAG: PAS domain S-box protein [Nitrospirota bacterium]